MIPQTAASGVKFATIYITQNAYGAPAIGALTTEIGVVSEEEWDVETVSESWLSAVKSDTAVRSDRGRRGIAFPLRRTL